MVKPTKARPAKRKSSADGAEKMYLKMRRAGPAITRAQACKFEKMEQDPTRHQWRRAAFAILSMSCEELFGKIDADREAAVALAATAQGIRDYAKAVQAMDEFCRVAAFRIDIGLCKRDDYDEVLAEAKVERKTGKRLTRPRGAAHG
jgi:hypothetical protein